MPGRGARGRVYQSSNEGVKKNLSDLFVSSQTKSLLTYSTQSHESHAPVT